MEFSRQEYLGGLPFPSPWDLPDPGIKPRSLALQADSLPTKPPGKIPYIYVDKRILMLCMYMCVHVCLSPGCRGLAGSDGLGPQNHHPVSAPIFTLLSMGVSSQAIWRGHQPHRMWGQPAPA